jgi:hypothetical protein
MRKLAMIGMCVLALSVGCKDDDDDDDVTPEIKVTAILSGANEVPNTTTPATGTVSGTYNEETNALEMAITYQQMTPTAWHIHRAAKGSNGPVVLDLGKTFTSPYTYTKTLTEEQEDELLDGMYYVNIHSTKHPNGEIRGQLEIVP